jgi:hypothetical protein
VGETEVPDFRLKKRGTRPLGGLSLFNQIDMGSSTGICLIQKV